MADYALPFLWSEHDNNGRPISGAACCVYYSGTTSLAPLWLDSQKNNAASNPIISDANGVFNQGGNTVFLDRSLIYDVIIFTANPFVVTNPPTIRTILKWKPENNPANVLTHQGSILYGQLDNNGIVQPAEGLIGQQGQFLSVLQNVNNQSYPGWTNLPVATTVNQGIIRIATQDEVNNGTDNTLAVSPSSLSNRLVLYTQNQYTSGSDSSGGIYRFWRRATDGWTENIIIGEFSDIVRGATYTFLRAFSALVNCQVTLELQQSNTACDVWWQLSSPPTSSQVFLLAQSVSGSAGMPVGFRARVIASGYS